MFAYIHLNSSYFTDTFSLWQSFVVIMCYNSVLLQTVSDK